MKAYEKVQQIDIGWEIFGNLSNKNLTGDHSLADLTKCKRLLKKNYDKELFYM